MASLDNMRKAEASNKKSNPDVEIAVRMTIKMLQEGGGMKVIADAAKTKDPAQVIGTFLAQMVAQLAEMLQGEMDVSPQIFLSKGGWLEKVLDYIEGEMGMPEEFSEQIYGQVLETIKAAAMSPEAARGAPPQGQAGPPQEAAPPQPGQPGVPPQGGLGG